MVQPAEQPSKVRVKGLPSVGLMSELVKAGWARAPVAMTAATAAAEYFIVK